METITQPTQTLPQPPKPPEPSRKEAGRRWVVPVAIFAALLLGGTVGYAIRGDSGDQTREQPATVAEAAAPTGPTYQTGPINQTAPTGPTAPTAEAGSSLDNPVARGEAAEAYGWSLKVVDFNPSANDVIEQADSYNKPPRKGTYAVVTVRFSRTSGNSADPFWDMEPALMVSGQSYGDSDDVYGLPDDWIDVGKVPPGGSGIGRFAFDVPKAGLESAVLYLVVTDQDTFDDADVFLGVN